MIISAIHDAMVKWNVFNLGDQMALVDDRLYTTEKLLMKVV